MSLHIQEICFFVTTVKQTFLLLCEDVGLDVVPERLVALTLTLRKEVLFKEYLLL